MRAQNNKLYEKILKISSPLSVLISALWFIFLPQYYRLGYVLLALSGVMLVLLALLNTEKISLFFRKKNSIRGINAVVTIVLVLLVAGAINYIAYRNEKRVDLTRSSVNTLSDQTIKVLKGLKDKIHFMAFLDPAVEGASFKHAMERYSYYTDQISYEIVDPNKEPVKARNYNITRYGTIIGFLNDSETRIESLTEEDLTNSIIKLTRTGKKKIYFLSGHAERDIDSDDAEAYSALKKIMSGQSYIAEKLDLLSSGNIPKDSSLLIIAGPKKTFFEKEISIIENYMKSGGPVFMLSDPSSPKYTVSPDDNVNRILSNFGIKLRNDIIIDPQSKLFGVTEAMPVVQIYDRSNPITADFKEVTIYPFAQSLDVSKADKKKYEIVELCRTADTSWGETGAKTGKIYFDKKMDNIGPLDVCVLVSDKQDRNFVVFGNSSFVTNQYVSHAANSDIFMNVVSYLVEDQDLISIRPKTDEAGKFIMPGGLLVGLFTVYVVPFSILAGGIVYWHKRRKK
jgi:ABC-type uncharacterized transport system involved in gliding motility auxiliary subunit